MLVCRTALQYILKTKHAYTRRTTNHDISQLCAIKMFTNSAPLHTNIRKLKTNVLRDGCLYSLFVNRIPSFHVNDIIQMNFYNNLALTWNTEHHLLSVVL